MKSLKLFINKFSFAVIAIICFSSLILSAQSKKSDLIISAGAGVNLNLHSADFKSIPNIETNFNGFTGGIGIGENLFAGIEYIFPKKMFDREIRGRINLGYSNLSADLKKDDFIGHIITGNTYTNGISEHIVKSTISVLMIEPEFVIFPLNDLPMGTFAGFQIGFPLKMNYIQEERLTNPSFGTFENGQRTREHFEGAIPNAASLFFGLSAGARYELYKFGDYAILPELRFNLGLTNLADNLNWKASSVFFSAVLEYNPAVSKPAPAQEPPTPVIPPPPQPEAPELAIKVYYKDKELQDGDTIKVNVRDSLFVTNYFVAPKIFFKENETDLNEAGHTPGSQEEAQSLSLIAVKKYMEEHPESGLTIISSSLDNENSEIVTRRVENITKKLNIEEKKVKKEKIIQKNKYRYPELADENRFVKIETSQNKQGFIIQGDTVIKSSFDNVEIETGTLIKSNEEYTFFGQIEAVSENKINLNEGKNNYNLNSLLNSNELKKGIELFISGKIKDKSNLGATAKMKLNLKADVKENTIIENEVNKDGRSYNEYILGFCEFGKADFYSINQRAVEFAKNSISSGKTIEIIPLTDSLGTEDYNKTLANKRADTALKLLSIKKESIKITIPDKYIFSNSTPEGRLLNRSVLVRIY